MNIFEVKDGCPLKGKTEQMTEDELQREYDFHIAQNIVQAISRDILMYSMKMLSTYPIVAHVHDEVIIEADPQIAVTEVCKQMSQVPPWAKGLLLDADGYECDFYQKD